MSILAIGRKHKKKGRTHKKKRKFLNKVGESKKKREREQKFPNKDPKKTEEICRKVFGPDNI